MSTRVALFCAALGATAVPLDAQSRVEPAPAPATTVREIDALVARFFDQLRSAQVSAALDVIFGSSPLWAGRTTERQAVASQIEGMLRIYGPLRTYELVEDDATGTLHLKRVYLVQHDQHVTRWLLHFVRVPSGWMLSHLSFNDQSHNWP